MLYFVFLYLVFEAYAIEIDFNGYIMYCPCMGRFGNQADQFLGALAFARGLSRTLVLPPWVTYPPNTPFQSLQIPFKEWFKIKPLAQFSKVITMEDFMGKLAQKIWPADDRIGFCYTFRDGKACAMKEGNPFGPFWNHFNVTFTSSLQHQDLLWDTSDERTKLGWLKRFPSEMYPVLAFQGAPGLFPSLEEHQYLQKYIYFSRKIDELSNKYIKEIIKGKKYVAIHLRNGIDFTRVCDSITQNAYTKFFASAQCTGYHQERPLTFTMCNPSKKEILKQVKNYIKQSNAEAIYVATDNDPMEGFFQKELKNLKVSVHYRSGKNKVEDPVVDIAVMSKAAYFIGNCVSTFSAFVRRQRESRNLPVAFFGLDSVKAKKRDEL